MKENDNFLTLGGDSFQAVQLINTVESSFHTTLPLLLETVLNQNFHCFVKLLQNTHSSLLLKPVGTAKRRNGKYYASKNTDNDNHTNLDITSSEIQHKESHIVQKSEKIFKMSVDPSAGSNDLASADVSQGARPIRASDMRGGQENITSQHPVKRKHESESLDFESNCVKCRCSALHVSSQCCRSTHGESAGFVGSRTRGNRTVLLSTDIVACGRGGCVVSRKLQVELLWKHDTGKCVDASPLVILDRWDSCYCDL